MTKPPTKGERARGPKACAGKSLPLTQPGDVLSSKPASAAASDQSCSAANGTSSTPPTTDVVIQVTLVQGGLTHVKAPVAVGGRYDGFPVAGATKAFDKLLDGWLTRAFDLGMIGSGLGQLFLVNLQRAQTAGKANVGNLLLAGMGEPGGFAQDGLRFLLSNITVAVKSMGHDQFAITLLGTRRHELPVGDAVRGIVDGILDGYERFRAIVCAVTQDRERFQRSGERPLSILLVDGDEQKLKQAHDAFEAIRSEQVMPQLRLEVGWGDKLPDDAAPEPSAQDTEPDVPVTLLRITRSKGGLATNADNDMFQFSALSELAAVPVREEELNQYFTSELPDRMTKACSLQQRQELGTFFSNYMIPDDFRKLTDGAANLTFEVDESTAVYPWEMAAQKKYSRTSFLGTSAAVSRQFRTVLSPPPTSAPPLNRSLSVLVIADPAPPGQLALPQARAEGLAIVDVLDQARLAWRGACDISVTVRIGSPDDATGDPVLEELRRRGSWVESAERCDPLEVAMRIVNRQYDVIHYAGHGLVDRKTRRAGLLFAPGCFLSATEIFRIRQVPRLVFANACFSAVTIDATDGELNGQLVGLAQAFFARGIPNFIGAGWPVDDTCARECARWFYARALGLRSPSAADGVIGTSPPATIGDALREARVRTLACNRTSSSWGAYQHYGRVRDKLLALPNAVGEGDRQGSAAEPQGSGGNARPTTFSQPFIAGGTPMTADTGADPNLVYVNGIDRETGSYAFAPRSIDALARQVLARPGVERFSTIHTESPRSFGVPFGMDPMKLDSAGWGIVFHEDTPQEVRAALKPLIDLRGRQAGARLKLLDYKKGEQTRDWYRRHRIAPGNIDPEIVPYYLLLVGPPDLLPFDFQYLIGVEYAVGRLSFDTAAEYELYARSIVGYETANAVPNAKEINYWGTRHLGDPATNMSATLLIDPLANGIAGAAGALKRPIHADVGYNRSLLAGSDATKAGLLACLHAAKPPAMLFTASHGMSVPSGRPEQLSDQGALLCQDWPGFGSIGAEHFLAATDVADDANVHGVVALLFACFGNGTPDVDQFLMDLSQTGRSLPLTPRPFISALPKRLLAHPRGSALAVIGHIDRAWGYSIQAAKASEAQIGTFRSSLGFILSGAPVGHAMCAQFGARYAALSTALASSTSPTALPGMNLSDRDLVTFWLERNDAQNYVMLGDPAVRIRKDALG